MWQDCSCGTTSNIVINVTRIEISLEYHQQANLAVGFGESDCIWCLSAALVQGMRCRRTAWACPTTHSFIEPRGYPTWNTAPPSALPESRPLGMHIIPVVQGIPTIVQVQPKAKAVFFSREPLSGSSSRCLLRFVLPASTWNQLQTGTMSDVRKIRIQIYFESCSAHL